MERMTRLQREASREGRLEGRGRVEGRGRLDERGD